ncbi:MAG: peptidoglycan-binding protein [Alphaproteobacteria bacterium]|nr:peptidoglycan-binding protein [Alphaproteobacteria bacterium]
MAGDRPTARADALRRDEGDPFDPLRLGTRLGKYVIVSPLGRGGFGVTYRARDSLLHQDVAIKEFMPTALARRQAGRLVVPASGDTVEVFQWGRSRFLEEARALARLDAAPAIVRVHDVFEDNGTAYMVMPLVGGQTLELRLQRDRALPQAAIDRLLAPLLDGLQALHDADVVHGDISPASIYLDGSGQPTLVDFAGARSALVRRLQSITGGFSSPYAAPEQAPTPQQGPWTDLYGLAATLYHCVAGLAPQSAAGRAQGDALVSATDLGKGRYAPGLLAAIDQGLMLDPAGRPQSVAAWRQIQEGAPTVEVPVRPAETVAPRVEPVAPRVEPAPPRVEPAAPRVEAPPPRVEVPPRVETPVPTPLKPRRAAAPVAARDGVGHRSMRAAAVGAGIGALAAALAGAWLVLAPHSTSTGPTPHKTVADTTESGPAAAPPVQDEESRRRAAEAARKAQEEAARRASDEKVAAEAAQRKAAEEKQAAEVAARRRSDDAEKQRAAAAEAARKAQEDAARRATEEKAAAEKQAAELAARRRADEVERQRAAAAEAARKAQEDAARRAAEEKAAAEKQAAELAARRQAEEAERQRVAAAEAARKAQEEATRRAAEEKAAAEAAARRVAEEKAAAAAEARRREEEIAAREAAEAARRQAEERARLEAEAKRKAEEQAAVAEAAARQREEEARRLAEEKARVEAAAREQAEAEMRARAAADVRRQVAEAARRMAEEAAQSEAESSPTSEAERQQQAEAAEAALNLSEEDRKRVQMALIALGHDVGAATGYFGPRTRAMIAAWQKKLGLPQTGHLTSLQLTALQLQAAPALAKDDHEPGKPADDKHKPEAKPQRPEAAEAALNMSDQDRKRVQAGLILLGHDIGAATGYFGPRTRTMIAAWQKTQGLPETGFLDAAQLAALDQQVTQAKRAEEEKRLEAEKRKAELDPRRAEAAEAALNLGEDDRKRVQVALSSLGHVVGATTGFIGPRTRAMITAWQKKQGLPETGYLNEAQYTLLQQQAAQALARYDAEQKRPESDLRQAEAEEAALRLSEQDRKRVQVALSSLGHVVGATTGYIGPRTRAMITAWQKKQGLPETGYLTAAQLATLWQQAAPALARFDQQQRSLDAEKQ